MVSPKRSQWRTGNASSEQLSAALRKLHERTALVHHQSAALDREIQASLVFLRRALLAVQEWPVDQLDVDLAILHGLSGSHGR